MALSKSTEKGLARVRVVTSTIYFVSQLHFYFPRAASLLPVAPEAALHERVVDALQECC